MESLKDEMLDLMNCESLKDEMLDLLNCDKCRKHRYSVVFAGICPDYWKCYFAACQQFMNNYRLINS